nr:MAG TPA: hypothetical protein [Caudoviricetes sp.]
MAWLSQISSVLQILQLVRVTGLEPVVKWLNRAICKHFDTLFDTLCLYQDVSICI